jgi:uncharacterized membrane protein YfcA
MSVEEALSYLAIGLLAGLMSGVFGIGGGSVRIPLLNVAGLPLLSAFAINFLVIPFASAVGAFAQKANIIRTVGLYAVVGGVVGEVLAAGLVGLIPTLALAIIFVVVSAVVVFGVISQRLVPAVVAQLHPGPRQVVTTSFGVSLITGLRGGSGASLFPAVFRGLGLNTHQAIATSLYVSIFTALGAIPIYGLRGDIPIFPAIFVLVGSMLGAGLGSKISLRAKPKWLDIGLSTLIIGMALLTVYRALRA